MPERLRALALDTHRLPLPAAAEVRRSGDRRTILLTAVAALALCLCLAVVRLG